MSMDIPKPNRSTANRDLNRRLDAGRFARQIGIPVGQRLDVATAIPRRSGVIQVGSSAWRGDDEEIAVRVAVLGEARYDHGAAKVPLLLQRLPGAQHTALSRHL